jgi:hypothetical protein
MVPTSILPTFHHQLSGSKMAHYFITSDFSEANSMKARQINELNEMSRSPDARLITPPRLFLLDLPEDSVALSAQFGTICTTALGIFNSCSSSTNFAAIIFSIIFQHPICY